MTLIKLYKRISDTFSDTFSKKENLKQKYTKEYTEFTECTKENKIQLPEIDCNYHLDFSLYMMDKMIHEIFSDLDKEKRYSEKDKLENYYYCK